MEEGLAEVRMLIWHKSQITMNVHGRNLIGVCLVCVQFIRSRGEDIAGGSRNVFSWDNLEESVKQKGGDALEISD